MDIFYNYHSMLSTAFSFGLQLMLLHIDDGIIVKQSESGQEKTASSGQSGMGCSTVICNREDVILGFILILPLLNPYRVYCLFTIDLSIISLSLCFSTNMVLKKIWSLVGYFQYLSIISMLLIDYISEFLKPDETYICSQNVPRVVRMRSISET